MPDQSIVSPSTSVLKAWSADPNESTIQQMMVVNTAKENLEQYFKLFKKTNTSSIKKVKSLLE